jgi:hypothetical protein
VSNNLSEQVGERYAGAFLDLGKSQNLSFWPCLPKPLNFWDFFKAQFLNLKLKNLP